MRAFFMGRLLVGVVAMGSYGVYKVYKFADHSLNYVEAEARVDSVDTVCSGRLKAGGETDFPCSEYSDLVAAKKDVSRRVTATITYVSPVDNTEHEKTMQLRKGVTEGGIMKVWVSTSDVDDIEQQ